MKLSAAPPVHEDGASDVQDSLEPSQDHGESQLMQNTVDEGIAAEQEEEKENFESFDQNGVETNNDETNHLETENKTIGEEQYETNDGVQDEVGEEEAKEENFDNLAPETPTDVAEHVDPEYGYDPVQNFQAHDETPVEAHDRQAEFDDFGGGDWDATGFQGETQEHIGDEFDQSGAGTYENDFEAGFVDSTHEERAEQNHQEFEDEFSQPNEQAQEENDIETTENFGEDDITGESNHKIEEEDEKDNFDEKFGEEAPVAVQPQETELKEDHSDSNTFYTSEDRELDGQDIPQEAQNEEENLQHFSSTYSPQDEPLQPSSTFEDEFGFSEDNQTHTAPQPQAQEDFEDWEDEEGGFSASEPILEETNIGENVDSNINETAPVASTGWDDNWEEEEPKNEEKISSEVIFHESTETPLFEDEFEPHDPSSTVPTSIREEVGSPKTGNEFSENSEFLPTIANPPIESTDNLFSSDAQILPPIEDPVAPADEAQFEEENSFENFSAPSPQENPIHENIDTNALPIDEDDDFWPEEGHQGVGEEAPENVVDPAPQASSPPLFDSSEGIQHDLGNMHIATTTHELYDEPAEDDFNFEGENHPSSDHEQANNELEEQNQDVLIHEEAGVDENRYEDSFCEVDATSRRLLATLAPLDTSIHSIAEVDSEVSSIASADSLADQKHLDLANLLPTISEEEPSEPLQQTTAEDSDSHPDLDQSLLVEPSEGHENDNKFEEFSDDSIPLQKDISDFNDESLDVNDDKKPIEDEFNEVEERVAEEEGNEEILETEPSALPSENNEPIPEERADSPVLDLGDAIEPMSNAHQQPMGEFSELDFSPHHSRPQSPISVGHSEEIIPEPTSQIEQDIIYDDSMPTESVEQDEIEFSSLSRSEAEELFLQYKQSLKEHQDTLKQLLDEREEMRLELENVILNFGPISDLEARIASLDAEYESTTFALSQLEESQEQGEEIEMLKSELEHVEEARSKYREAIDRRSKEEPSPRNTSSRTRSLASENGLQKEKISSENSESQLESTGMNQEQIDSYKASISEMEGEMASMLHTIDQQRTLISELSSNVEALETSLNTLKEAESEQKRLNEALSKEVEEAQAKIEKMSSEQSETTESLQKELQTLREEKEKLESEVLEAQTSHSLGEKMIVNSENPDFTNLSPEVLSSLPLESLVSQMTALTVDKWRAIGELQTMQAQVVALNDKLSATERRLQVEVAALDSQLSETETENVMLREKLSSAQHASIGAGKTRNVSFDDSTSPQSTLVGTISISSNTSSHSYDDNDPFGEMEKMRKAYETTKNHLSRCELQLEEATSRAEQLDQLFKAESQLRQEMQQAARDAKRKTSLGLDKEIDLDASERTASDSSNANHTTKGAHSNITSNEQIEIANRKAQELDSLLRERDALVESLEKEIERLGQSVEKLERSRADTQQRSAQKIEKQNSTILALERQIDSLERESASKSSANEQTLHETIATRDVHIQELEIELSALIASNGALTEQVEQLKQTLSKLERRYQQMKDKLDNAETNFSTDLSPQPASSTSITKHTGFDEDIEYENEEMKEMAIRIRALESENAKLLERTILDAQQLGEKSEILNDLENELQHAQSALESVKSEMKNSSPSETPEGALDALDATKTYDEALINGLNAEIADLRTRMEEKEDLEQATRERLAHVETIASSAQREQEQWSAQLKAAKSEIESKNEIIAELEREVSTAATAHDSTVKQMRHLEDQLAKSAREMEKVVEEKLELSSRMPEANNALAEVSLERDELRNQINDYEAHIESLKREISENGVTAAQLASLTAQLEASREEMAMVERELDSTQERLATSETNLQQKTLAAASHAADVKTITDLKRQLAEKDKSMMEAYAAFEAELAFVAENANSNSSPSKETSEDDAEKIKELQSTIAQLEKKLADQVAQKDEEDETNLNEVSALKASYASQLALMTRKQTSMQEESDKEIAAVKKMAEEMESELKLLKEKLDEKDAIIADWEASYTSVEQQLQEKILSSKNDDEGSQNEIIDLRRDNDILKAENQSLSATNNEYMQKIEKMEQRKEEREREFETEISQSKASIESLQAKVSELNLTNDELQQQCQELLSAAQPSTKEEDQQEIERLSSALTKALEEASSNKQIASEMESESLALHERINSLNQEKAEISSRAQDYETEIIQLTQSLEAKQKEIELATSTIQQKERQLSEEKSGLDQEISSTVQDYETKISQLTQSLEDKQKEIELANSTLQQREKELEEEKSELDREISSRIQDYESKISQLTQSLEDKQKEIELVHSTLQQREEELSKEKIGLVSPTTRLVASSEPEMSEAKFSKSMSFAFSDEDEPNDDGGGWDDDPWGSDEKQDDAGVADESEFITSTSPVESQKELEYLRAFLKTKTQECEKLKRELSQATASAARPTHIVINHNKNNNTSNQTLNESVETKNRDSPLFAPSSATASLPAPSFASLPASPYVAPKDRSTTSTNASITAQNTSAEPLDLDFDSGWDDLAFEPLSSHSPSSTQQIDTTNRSSSDEDKEMESKNEKIDLEDANANASGSRANVAVPQEYLDKFKEQTALLATLEKHNSSLKLALENRDAELAEGADQYNAISKECESLQVRVSELEAQVAAIEAQKNEIEEKLVSSVSVDLLNDLKARNEELEIELEDMRKTMIAESEEKEVSKVSETFSSSTNADGTLTDIATSDIGNNYAQLMALQSELDRSKATINTLQSLLANRPAANTSSSTTLAHNTEETDDWDSWEAQEDDISESKKIKPSSMLSTSSQVPVLENEIESLRHLIEQKDADLSSLRLEAAEWKQKFSEISLKPQVIDANDFSSERAKLEETIIEMENKHAKQLEALELKLLNQIEEDELSASQTLSQRLAEVSLAARTEVEKESQRRLQSAEEVHQAQKEIWEEKDAARLARTQALENQVETLAARLDSLNAEYESASAQLKDANAEKEEMNARLAQLSADKTRLALLAEEYEAKIKSFGDGSSNASHALKEGNFEIFGNSSDFSHLEEDAGLSSQLEQYRLQLEESKEAQMSAEAASEMARGRIRELETEIGRVSAQVKTLQQDLSVREAQWVDSQKALSSARKDREEAQEKFEEIEISLSELTRRNAESETRLKTMEASHKKEMQLRDQEARAREEQLTEKLSEISSGAHVVPDSPAKNASSSTPLMSEWLEQQLKSHAMIAERLTSENAKLSKGLVSGLVDVQTPVERLASAKQSLEMRVDRLEKDLKRKTTELAARTEERDSLRAQCEALTNHSASLTRKVATNYSPYQNHSARLTSSPGIATQNSSAPNAHISPLSPAAASAHFASYAQYSSPISGFGLSATPSDSMIRSPSVEGASAASNSPYAPRGSTH